MSFLSELYNFFKYAYCDINLSSNKPHITVTMKDTRIDPITKHKGFTIPIFGITVSGETQI